MFRRRPHSIRRRSALSQVSGDEHSTFDAAWLALREAADHRSRSMSLVEQLSHRWRQHRWTRILDLGSGTGSNLRYLAPRLPRPQEWTLTDRDSGLLTVAASEWPGVSVRKLVGDLAHEGLAEVPNTHLVTASALLDLVSQAWLSELVAACRNGKCGVLLALTFDGEIRWSSDLRDPTATRPDQQGRSMAGDPLDELVLRAVNEHQRRDKGLGPALGARGTTVAEALFREAGYETWTAPSPWIVLPTEAELAKSLIRGWESAALEERPRDQDRLRSWVQRKLGLVERGSVTLRVGHLDLLALPG